MPLVIAPEPPLSGLCFGPGSRRCKECPGARPICARLGPIVGPRVGPAGCPGRTRAPCGSRPGMRPPGLRRPRPL
eukprot:4748238-Lingulodinium_polyedra.AAC.1